MQRLVPPGPTSTSDKPDQHADQPPWIAAETALDTVQVPAALGEAAVARLTTLGVPCRMPPTTSTGTHMVFLVPAGAATLPWPRSVTYLSGGLWPVTALDAAHHVSDAYRALVTPPTLLWSVLAALSASPPANCCPTAGQAAPGPGSHGAPATHGAREAREGHR